MVQVSGNDRNSAVALTGTSQKSSMQGDVEPAGLGHVSLPHFQTSYDPCEGPSSAEKRQRLRAESQFSATHGTGGDGSLDLISARTCRLVDSSQAPRFRLKDAAALLALRYLRQVKGYTYYPNSQASLESKRFLAAAAFPSSPLKSIARSALLTLPSF